MVALSDHVPAPSQSQCSRLGAGTALRGNCPGVPVNVIFHLITGAIRSKGREREGARGEGERRGEGWERGREGPFP